MGGYFLIFLSFNLFGIWCLFLGIFPIKNARLEAFAKKLI
jgi:hypothetical protein